MTRATRYVDGGDVAAVEELRDKEGRVVDDEYVAAAVADTLAHVRGRGRPSLSQHGESPLLRVRLPHDLDLAVRLAAQQAGTSRADWVRDVLDQATRRSA